jgi:uncharacterized protein YdeI (YjbR/CyaY-like superfamily)
MRKMKELGHKYFKNKESFRSWLEKKFDISPGIWIIFYKKHTKTECIKYDEALDEALCYGWIDSIVKRLDEEKYIRKFSPRKNISNWSDVNKKKVLSLIEQGRMTEEGLNKIDIYLEKGRVDWKINELKEKISREFVIPDFILTEFAKNEPALRNFNELSKTNKKYYIGWITSAKKEETILKRLKESIELLKENKELGLK